jgi:hypothetical protein
MRRLVTLAELAALLGWSGASPNALKKKARRFLAAIERSSGVTLLDRSGSAPEGRARCVVNLEKLREINPDLFKREDAAEEEISKLRAEILEQKKRAGGLERRIEALEKLLLR